LLLAEVVEVQVREQAVEQVDIKLVLYRFLEALHIP
jgi:hypothetical protein